jgi:hypothetical protein
MRKTIFFNRKIVYDNPRLSEKLAAKRYEVLKPFLVFSRVFINKKL